MADAPRPGEPGERRIAHICDLRGPACRRYYALAAGAVEISNATGRLRRNMPDPVPIAVLGRLAIDRGFQGNGLGRALVRDAGQRVLQAADIIGIRGILVHVLSPEAEAFYHALGLEASALQPMTLMATLADLRAALI